MLRQAMGLDSGEGGAPGPPEPQAPPPPEPRGALPCLPQPLPPHEPAQPPYPPGGVRAADTPAAAAFEPGTRRQGPAPIGDAPSRDRNAPPAPILNSGTN